ncbi:LysE family translocator [Aeromicrobium sp. CF3.5]|uniref:LysE family translocator n=1 Tax=Aeromicrobium sp. CF3.5 TaxID=3373078 RepID=UPI003EE6253F
MLSTGQVDVAVLPGFIAVIALFLAPPGPDMAYMLAIGLDRGRRSALAAILGIGTGMSVYAVAVVVGVGRAAESQPLLFDAVKLAGAAYLVWLAVQTVGSARATAAGHAPPSTGRPYLRGVLVSLANPKVLLFFLSVLPQFLGDAQNPALQLAMLGAVNVLTEVVLYGAIGVLAGSLHERLKGSRTAGAALGYLAGTVYVALAVVVLTDVLAGSALG